MKVVTTLKLDKNFDNEFISDLYELNKIQHTADIKSLTNKILNKIKYQVMQAYKLGLKQGAASK